MENAGNYDIKFGSVLGTDASSISQFGVQNNYYNTDQNAKQNLVDEFGTVDPREERTRILGQKDALLEGSCAWVFDDPAFKSWWSDDVQSNLLWLHGDPGKGKTMICSAIIDELSDRLRNQPEPALGLAYFFVQRTDVRLNTAEAILKGLIYSLFTQSNAFAKYLQENHRQRGSKGHLESKSSFWSLLTLFQGMLEKVPVKKVFLCIDALDECATDMVDLLENITRQHGTKTRWLITSRNEMRIRERLEYADVGVHTSLELNSVHVEQTVKRFVQVKIDKIARMKRYRPELKETVVAHLQANANGTFLWVALVCKELEKLKQREVESKLYRFPSGLGSLYEQMLNCISELEDGDEVAFCYQLLRTAVIAFRPLALQEIGILGGLPKDVAEDPQSIEELISQCGSFFTIREGIVRFVHQSATDFLANKTSDTALSGSLDQEHRNLAMLSISMMSSRLRRNICHVQDPSATVASLLDSQIEASIPSPLQYACIFGLRHALATVPVVGDLEDEAPIHCFLKKCLLHWFEALAWLKTLTTGIETLLIIAFRIEAAQKARKINHSSQLRNLIADTDRLLASFWDTVTSSPLQLYYGALPFAPSSSIITCCFSGDLPSCLISLHGGNDNWGEHIRLFEGHTQEVTALAVHLDNGFVASASAVGRVILWNKGTGMRQSSIEERGKVDTIAFSPNGSLLAYSTETRVVQVWDLEKFDKLHNLECDCSFDISILNFSANGKAVLAASKDGMANMWSIDEERPQPTSINFTGGLSAVVVIAQDGALLTLATDFSVKLWIFTSGNWTSHTLHESPRHIMESWMSSDLEKKWEIATISLDGSIMAASERGSVWIWNFALGKLNCLNEDQTQNVSSMAISPDGRRLACGTTNGVITLWEPVTYSLIALYEAHQGTVRSLVFSSDGLDFVSGATDGTVKMWVSDKRPDLRRRQKRDRITRIAFSTKLNLIACGFQDGSLKLLQAYSGNVLERLEVPNAVPGDNPPVSALEFCTESQLFASGSRDGYIRLWQISSKRPYTMLKHPGRVLSIAFSTDNTKIAATSDTGTLNVWDIKTKELFRTLTHRSSDWIEGLCFSPDDHEIAICGVEGDQRFEPSSSYRIQCWHLWKDDFTAMKVASRPRVIKYSQDGKLIGAELLGQRFTIYDAKGDIRALTGPYNLQQARRVKISRDGSVSLERSSDLGKQTDLLLQRILALED